MNPELSQQSGHHVPAPLAWLSRSLRNLCRLLSALCIVLTFTAPAFATGGEVIAPFPVSETEAGKQEAKAMAVDSAGNIIVAGYSNNGGMNNDYRVVKFKADGSGLAWTAASFDKAAGDDTATAVVVDSNNNIIVTGYAWNGADYDIYTIKYDGATGTELWQRSFAGAAGGGDVATSIAVDAANNIYVAGYSANGNIPSNDDFLILKYAPDGTPGAPEIFNASFNNHDRISAIAANSDGIVVTGYSSKGGADFDILTRTYDNNLTFLKEWRKSSPGSNDDRGVGVRLDSAGNVIVTGYLVNGTHTDMYTAKYNATTGAISWEKSFDGGFDDEPRALWVDSDGNAYVTGNTFTLNGHDDVYTICYNEVDGAKAWDAVYHSGNQNADVPVGIVVGNMLDGGVYVTSYAITTVNDNFATLKYKKDTGVLLWQRSFNGPANRSDRPVGIGMASLEVASDVCVAGWSDGATSYDFVSVKYDHGPLNAPSALVAKATSNTEISLNWNDNSANEHGFKIERKLGATGTYAQIATTGANVTTYADSGLTPNSYYYYRVRANNLADGDTDYSNESRALTKVVSYDTPVWTYLFNSADKEDVATAITVGSDDHPVVTGYSEMEEEGVPGSYSFDYLTMKLDRANKSLKWKARFDSGDGGTDMATGVALDNDGDAIVTGTAELMGEDTKSDDLYTIKYETAGYADPVNNPAMIWDHQFGTEQGIDLSVAVMAAKEGSDKSVVIGYGLNAANNYDIFLIKYNADGTRSWTPAIYDSGRDDLPTAVAFAPSGDLFVTGYTKNGAGDYDWFTAKYNGATGAKIWDATYGGAGTSDDKALSLSVDASGNVLVTGFAINATFDEEFVTIKYDGANVSSQREIWKKIHNGLAAADGDDRGIIVKLDPIDGAVVVAGTNYVSPTDSDFHLIRYNVADGAIIWERNFDLPATYDYVTAMTIDSSGYIYVTGTTRAGLDTEPAFNSTSNIMSLIYDFEGTFLGAMTYDGTGREDKANAIATNYQGEAFVAGSSRNALNPDYLVLKQKNNYILVPAPLTPVTQADSTKINVTWRENTPGTSFRLERTLGPVLQDSIWVPVTTAASGTTSFMDTGLTAGTNYCYRIYAFSGSLNSRTIVSCGTTTLAAPTLAPLTVDSSTQITLNWSQVTGNTGYKIERKIGAGAWTDLTTKGVGVITHTDSGLTAGTSYSYRISTNSTVGYSLPSNEPSIFTKPVAPTLNVPTGITNTLMVLSWNAPTGASTYTLQYKVSGGSYADFACAIPSATSCTVTGLSPNSSYSFQVKAVNSGGESVWSSEQTATAALAVPNWATAPATPTNITNNSLTLTWTNVRVTGDALTTYELEKNDTTAGTGWVASGCTMPSLSLNCTVTGLTTGNVYNFQVRAVNADGVSVFSPVKAGTPVLGVPTLAAATGITDTQMSLSWNNNIYGATKYTLQRGGVDVPGCTDIAGGSCLVTGLSPNVSYSYQVKAGNAAGYSALSNTISAKTVLATPTLSSASGSSTSSIVLVWSAVPAASGYTIEKSTCTDSTTPSTCRGADALYGAWSNHATGVTGTTATVSSLAAGTNYRFRITATVSGNASASASNVLHAWTYLTAPTLSVEPLSASALTLNWDQQPGETNYTVELSTTGSGGTYTAIPAATGLAANTITWPHTGLALATEYCYQVKAYSNETVPQLVVYSTPQCKTTPPNAPALSKSQGVYESSYTVIEDASKNWTIADYFINQPVVITSGGNIYTRMIAGNTQTALYATPAFTTEAISAGDSYVILNTVSSVATGNNSAYFLESLSDGYKTWGNSRQWVGYKIKIINSVNTANIGQERVITLNGTTSYFMGSPLPVAIVAGDTYRIASFFGTTTAAGSNVLLTHSGAGWTVNAWTNANDGYYLMMTSGANNGHARKILSNTATTITTDAFPNASGSGDTYLIAPPARIGSFYGKALAGGTTTTFSENLTLSGNWGGWEWATDSLKDNYVIMTSGSNKDQIRKIASNTTAGAITVTLPFPSSVAQNDTYLIASAAQIASYRGNAVGSGSSATVLEDTANSWGTNDWTGGGHTLIMTSGANNGQARTITGQSATTLTVSSPFTGSISASDSYLISAITATKGSGTVTTPVTANPSLPYKGTARMTLTNGEAEFYSVAPGFGNNYNYGLLGMKFPYWPNKVSIAITNFQPNFQTKVTITKANYPEMLPTYADIRFYDETANTELPYWIESSSASSATVWFKTGTNNNVWMHYGNPNAVSTSDGTSTFEFFDDFTGNDIDSSKWTINNGTGFSVANGRLRGSDTSGRLTSKSSFSSGVIQEMKANTVSIAANGQMMGGFYLNANDCLGWLNHPAPNGSHYRNNNSWANNWSVTPANNMLYTMTVKNATTVNIRMDNIDTSAAFWVPGDVTHTLGSKPIVLGTRFDDIMHGQPYESYWDWIRVRKYAATPPSATAGTTASSNPWTTDFDEQFDYNVLSGLLTDDASLPYRYLSSSYATARFDFQSPSNINYRATVNRGRVPLQDSGRTTAFSASRDTLYDTRTMAGSSTPWKTWAVDQWKDYYLQISYGANNQLVRKVVSNTSDSITLDRPLPNDTVTLTGTAATNGNSETKLVDSVITTWTTNQWANYYLHMSDGPNAGQTRKIISNDASSVTVEGTGFTAPIASGNSYRMFPMHGDVYRFNVIAGTAAINGSTQSGINSSKTLLIDSSHNTGSTLPAKDWVANQWIGFHLYMSSGPNIGLSRTITGNTANSITVGTPFPYQISSSDAYVIFDPRTEAQAVEAYWVDLYDEVTWVSDLTIIPTSETSGRVKFSKSGNSLMFYTAPTGGAWQLRRQLDLKAGDAFKPIQYLIYQLGRLPHAAGTSQRTKIYYFQQTTTPPAATNLNFSSFTPEVGHTFRRPNSFPGLTYSPLEISWNKIDAAINGYEIERCLSTDHQKPSVRTVDACTTLTQAQPVDGTTRIINAASVAGLTAGYTYRFRVRAKYNATDFTAWSDAQWYTVTPPAPVMTAPAAGTATTVQLTPTWTNVNGDNGYNLYWKVRSGASCSDDNWNGPVALGINVATYNHAGLTPGTFYCYKVNAIGPSGTPATPDSAFSTIVSQTTKPQAPGTITFSGQTSSSITVSWPDVTGNSGYQVDRSLDNATWTNNVGTVGPGVTSFTNNTGLIAGTLYYYRVSANSSAGFSAVSTVQSTYTTPVATTLTLAVVSSDQINLSWPVVFGATDYKVERKTGAGGTYSEITNLSMAYSQKYCGYDYPSAAPCNVLSPISMSYQNTGLTENTYYCYQVKTRNSNGVDSVPSTEQCATTSAMPRQNLTATAVNSLKVRLDWTPIACALCNSPTGFEIERLMREGNWVKIVTVPGATFTYTDTMSLSPSQRYRYRVRAFSAADFSPYSDASVMMPAFVPGDETCP